MACGCTKGSRLGRQGLVRKTNGGALTPRTSYLGAGREDEAGGASRGRGRRGFPGARGCSRPPGPLLPAIRVELLLVLGVLMRGHLEQGGDKISVATDANSKREESMLLSVLAAVPWARPIEQFWARALGKGVCSPLPPRKQGPDSGNEGRAERCWVHGPAWVEATSVWLTC